MTRYYRTPNDHVLPEYEFSAAYRANCTPVVVIDPANLDDVKRVMHAVLAHGYNYEYTSDSQPNLQAALRSLIEPPKPKPPEPTGLGAVVEDGKGLRWVRAGPGDSFPVWACADNKERVAWSYASIDAVKVLSEGVR